MLLQVPLAFFAVLVLDLSLPVAIAVVAISDFIKVIFCYQRYFSKKWVNVFTGM
jgi:Na+-driven multidrug efflux pump